MSVPFSLDVGRGSFVTHLHLFSNHEQLDGSDGREEDGQEELTSEDEDL